MINPSGEVKDYADQQTQKMQEMIDSIRAVHGDFIGDRMSVVGNLLSFMTQNNTMLVGLYSCATDAMPIDAAISGLIAITELVAHNKAMSRSVFDHLFSDEKTHKEMAPFYDEMVNLMNNVVRKIVR